MVKNTPIAPRPEWDREILTPAERNKIAKRAKLSVAELGFMDIEEMVPVGDSDAITLFLQRSLGCSSDRIKQILIEL